MKGRYQIRLKEQVGPALKAVLVGFDVINPPGGGAILTGMIEDQAALRGLLQRIFDLGLTLISLIPVE